MGPSAKNGASPSVLQAVLLDQGFAAGAPALDFSAAAAHTSLACKAGRLQRRQSHAQIPCSAVEKEAPAVHHLLRSAIGLLMRCPSPRLRVCGAESKESKGHRQKSPSSSRKLDFASVSCLVTKVVPGGDSPTGTRVRGSSIPCTLDDVGTACSRANWQGSRRERERRLRCSKCSGLRDIATGTLLRLDTSFRLALSLDLQMGALGMAGHSLCTHRKALKEGPWLPRSPSCTAAFAW